MNDDFVISTHALERFEERFPDLYENDCQAAKLMHGECQSAMDAGRSGKVAPLELANNDLSRWNPQPGDTRLVVWTADKSRGYVLLETTEGQLVTTVLKGKERESARRMLYRGERPSRVKKGELH